MTYILTASCKLSSGSLFNQKQLHSNQDDPKKEKNHQPGIETSYSIRRTSIKKEKTALVHNVSEDGDIHLENAANVRLNYALHNVIKSLHFSSSTFDPVDILSQV